jgi:KGK domain
MSKKFNNLAEQDINGAIHFPDGAMLKIGEFISTVINIIKNNNQNTINIHNQLSSKGGSPNGNTKQWFVDGVACELLTPKHNWRKGKVRINITVEFIPDEPEILNSPLDDIRQEMNDNK